MQYHYDGLFQLLPYNILIGRVLNKLSGLYNRRDIQIMQVCEYLGAKPKCRVHSGKLSLLNLFSLVYLIGLSSILVIFELIVLAFVLVDETSCCCFLLLLSQKKMWIPAIFFYGLCEALITWDKPASLQFELVTSTS